MRVNLLTSFAAGILIATTISGAVYLTDQTDASTKPVKVKEQQKDVTIQPSDDEMKNKLAAAGYVVQTKAEYDKNINDVKAAAQKATPAVDNKSKKTVYRVVLNVANGMTSIDVGRALEKAKIIDNAFKFSKEIEKKGIEHKLRPGTFVVDSDMPHEKIISTIFK
ncbi:aminodeoxychorismate lyase [Bacillus xiapuensis]|uniref:Aminodeoxychorismate lyase n=1 Tax=Bacillus xiapuensis TaxID=2014075 RepID=A0ABU6NER8_9BACI|nr:aminodeoxychorismate lyase [Bacillus xiapuensis]